MVRLISRQRGGLAALKLTKLIGIDDFPAAKDSGKVLIIIIYCYLIIIIIIIIIIVSSSSSSSSSSISLFIYSFIYYLLCTVVDSGCFHVNFHMAENDEIMIQSNDSND